MGVNSYVIRSGELRHRVTFQRRITAQDSTGQAVESWQDAFTAWADVSPLNGRELIAAQQLQSSVTHMITVRYRSELADPKAVADMRIVFGTRLFNINACLIQDERRRAVEIQATEGLNDG